MRNSDTIVVLVTVASVRSARALGRRLVAQRLAACANIVPGLQSIFHWQGKVRSASEALIVIKTTRRRYPALERAIKAVHSYSVPEVIALPIVRGSKDYLDWVRETTR